MIEIILNWHPIFVHFSIGLLGASVLTFLAAAILLPKNHRWQPAWQNMANGCLWLGAGITVITLIAGMFAYNSVTHDSASHAAMTLHRNWAVPTAVLFICLAVLAFQRTRHTIPSILFLTGITIGGGVMLALTGYLGGTAVYRHGLGVMSLPTAEAIAADGHQHRHGNHSPQVDEIETPPPIIEAKPAESHHGQSDHAH